MRPFFLLDRFKDLRYALCMKLTLQMKLLTDEPQVQSLRATLKAANLACNQISAYAWEHKVFNQFRLHGGMYRTIRDASGLSAQVVVRCISKVADAYKLDRKTPRDFRPLGAITYDSRILSYNLKQQLASIWTLDGRQKIPFVCHNEKLLPYIKGEADLVLKQGKWYLFQTVEVPEEDVIDVEDFIGVDFGLVNIATLSSGKKMSGKELEEYRKTRQRVRSSLQSKGTKGAKKALKRLSGRERRTASLVNHTIAKKIVETAINTKKGIALEDLTGIRKNSEKKGRPLRTRIGRWNFSQLRGFIEYKARRYGIPVILVDPRYTSQTCSSCYRIGIRRSESFTCTCGYSEHADVNAARNIRQAGLLVNQPEQSAMHCRLSHGQVESRLL